MSERVGNSYSELPLLALSFCRGPAAGRTPDFFPTSYFFVPLGEFGSRLRSSSGLLQVSLEAAMFKSACSSGCPL